MLILPFNSLMKNQTIWPHNHWNVCQDSSNVQSILFIPAFNVVTRFVVAAIWMEWFLIWRWEIVKNTVSNPPRNMCCVYLLDLHRQGDSNKDPQHMPLEVGNTIYLNISNYLPYMYLELRICSIRTVIITSFFVISRDDCIISIYNRWDHSHRHSQQLFLMGEINNIISETYRIPQTTLFLRIQYLTTKFWIT